MSSFGDSSLCLSDPPSIFFPSWIGLVPSSLPIGQFFFSSSHSLEGCPQIFQAIRSDRDLFGPAFYNQRFGFAISFASPIFINLSLQAVFDQLRNRGLLSQP